MGLKSEGCLRILGFARVAPSDSTTDKIITAIRPELRVVAEIADGLGAVQKAQELKPDLVLLDIGLPNLKWNRSCESHPPSRSGARIIFVTQNSNQDVVRAALGTGAQGYVLKTDAGSELLTAVAGVLD